MKYRLSPRLERLPRFFVLLALVALAPLALAGRAAASDSWMPAIFGDHMVLQRETEAPVWGRCGAGLDVYVSTSWHDRLFWTTSDADGRWMVKLPTGEVGGPHAIEVRIGDAKSEAVHRFSDVLFGEVWICSGQSNMEWPMSATDGAEEALADAGQPLIRLFDVARAISKEPLEDVEGTWRICTPETVRGFSAVGYWFGRNLLDELNVPIGLIGSNWGGTAVEAWTSHEGIEATGEFPAVLDRIDASLRDESKELTLDEQRAEWWRKLESNDPGWSNAWYRPGFDTTDWRPAELPGTFSDIDLGGHDGCVWYKRTFELPEDWRKQQLVLELGPIDDMDVVFLNGARVGYTQRPGHHTTPRAYPFPGSAAQAGTNELVMCVLDTGGPGTVGLAGGKPAPMRVRLASAEPGTGIPLEGTWRAHAGTSLGPVGGFPWSTWFNQNTPTALYNGMIAPLVPYAIQGAIWYQGEANRSRAVQYRKLFPGMIKDWRAKWGGREFPFYLVQIAPFGYGGDSGEAALLREAQLMALRLPNTGMAVTMDVGNPSDIHPRDKQTVGHRLALWALAKTYELPRPHSGPIFSGSRVEGGAMRLAFLHSDGGLETRDGKPVSHLQIAGEDRVFHPATGTIEGEELVVKSPEVPEPVAVRYAWGAADQPNLQNAAGLPSTSFRTDDWD